MTSIHPFVPSSVLCVYEFVQSGSRKKSSFDLNFWGLGFIELVCHFQNAETMFATAVLWARKIGPRPVKLSNLGEQVEIASQALHKILEQHGPLTVTDCWNLVSQMENHGLKSKRHMKMMLRWMRERRAVRTICQHGESGSPNDREFLFSVVPPKVAREPRITDSAATPAE